MTRKKKIRVILLIAIPVVLIGMYLLQHYVIGSKPIEEPAPTQTRGGSRAIPVKVYVAQLQDPMGDTRVMAGSLLSNEEVDIASEIQGKVVEILFKEGSKVNKGDILVRVNDDDLQAQLKRYQFQEKTLKENVERQKILFEREAISQQAYDDIMTQYNVLLADIELLNVRIERTRIRAPFSGTIGFRTISEGSYIQIGASIAHLVDNSTLKVEFNIPERYIQAQLMGKQISFTTADDTDKVYHATVYAMEPRLEAETRSIILRARYVNVRDELRPGMSAWVSLPPVQSKPVIQVPTEAVVPSIDGMNLWVVKNGNPEMVPVEVGTRGQTSVEILKGITPGDSVIITGLMQLRPGLKIQVTE